MKNEKMSKQRIGKKRGWVKDIVLVGGVVVLALFFWRQIPSLQFGGEGGYYFAEPHFSGFDATNFFKKGNFFPLQEDLLAKILIRYLIGWFGSNVSGYMSFLLGWMVLTMVVMYGVAKEMSGSRLAAVFTMALFGLGHVGNFNMWASGGYQYFLQRAILMLPDLVALGFLARFLNTGRWRWGVAAVTGHWFTVFLGFYATWFLPVPVICLLVAAVLKWREGKGRVLGKLVMVALLILGNWWIIQGGPTTHNASEGNGIIGFLLKGKVETVARVTSQQLSVITLPEFWETGVGQVARRWWGLEWRRDKPIWQVEGLTWVLFVLGAGVVWKWKPEWRGLALAAFGGMVAMLAINVNMTSEVFRAFGTLRYYYFPWAMWSVFWGMVLSTLVFKGRKMAVVVFVGLGLWMGYNGYAIGKNFVYDEWMHTATHDSFAVMQYLSPELKSGPTRLYLTGPVGWYGLAFGWHFWGWADSVWSLDLPDLPALARDRVKPEEIWVFQFNYETRKLDDKTEEYRTELGQLEKGVKI